MAVIVPTWPFTFDPSFDCDLVTDPEPGAIVTTTNQPVQAFRPYITLNQNEYAEAAASPVLLGGGQLTFIHRWLIKTEHPVSDARIFYTSASSNAVTHITLADGRTYFVTDSMKYLDPDTEETLWQVIVLRWSLGP